MANHSKSGGVFRECKSDPYGYSKICLSPKYKLQKFGNIPFNISTEIVKKITFESQANNSYLIVEKGFSKRLKNLQRALGLLLMVEMDIKILTKVPRMYFHPKPSVDSVLIILERHKPLILKKTTKNINRLFIDGQTKNITLFLLKINSDKP